MPAHSGPAQNPGFSLIVHGRTSLPHMHPVAEPPSVQQVHFTPDMHEPGQPNDHHRGECGPHTSCPAHVAQIIRPGQQGQTARWAPQQGLRRRT